MPVTDPGESFFTDVEGLLERFDVPTASVVAGADDRVWAPATAKEMEASAVFEVASLSKTATAVAIMALVDEGDLELDDAVGDHLQTWRLPTGSFDPAEVTVRGLLSHTAGLPEGVPTAELDEPMRIDDPAPSTVEVLEGVRGYVPAEVVAVPGQGFTYSNPGYGLLERLIEDVTGTSYSEAMQRLVFEPLDMHDTGFQDDPDLLARVVPGHRAAGDPVPRYRRLPRAAGGMLSTGPDVAKLIHALVTPSSEGGLLSDASLEELATVPEAAEGAFGLGDDGGYALGLATGTLPGGRRFIANNGSHEGYNALYVAVPDERAYLVVLTNAETGLGLELELAIRWFDDTIGERPAIATTFVNIRRGIDIGTRLLLVITLLIVVRQVFQLATGRRSRPAELSRRRLLLRTLPALVAAAGVYVSFNTGTLTGPMGGLPPARFISASQDTYVLWLALGLTTLGTFATAAPPTSNTRRRTGE